ncbi:hypothetical protein ACFY15_35455 [Streptomyces sp. NPDC001373]|uniref:hypothetical protein n=1 Tax=Streptomyces sp. NPDC001373 TaxID=3364565 RepID=UPI0036C63888
MGIPRTRTMTTLAVMAVVAAGCTSGGKDTSGAPAHQGPADPSAAASSAGESRGPRTGNTVIGDAAIAREEAACTAQQPNSPWYRTLVPFEHYDSGRTSLHPCAKFPGSMTGPNVVKAYPTTADVYYSQFDIATRGVNDMYVYGGGNGDANPPALQTFVAKVQPGTMKQIWRTNLSNAQANNELHVSGAVDIMADGNIVAISDHTLYKLDGTTGKILIKQDMPTGESALNDSAFNGINAFPDGTIVVRSLNRPAGCTLNGYSAAAYKCPGAPNSAKPSIIGTVDPKTLKVLNWTQLKGNVLGRVTTSRYQGHDYAYITTPTQIYRYVWDGKTIAQDSTWGPVTYAKAGQTQAGAPVIMGDWVVFSSNGAPAKVPLSVIAIHQKDATRTTRMDPNPTLQPGQYSYYYAKVSADPVNNRIYVMDFGLGTASAIDFRNGTMSLAWKVKQRSNSYITLIGPADRRVFVNANARSDETDPTKYNPGPTGANYKDQIQWRDARTGRLLAASDFYAPATSAGTVPPGYGGLIYDILFDGHAVVMAVRPAKPGETPTPKA